MNVTLVSFQMSLKPPFSIVSLLIPFNVFEQLFTLVCLFVS